MPVSPPEITPERFRSIRDADLERLPAGKRDIYAAWFGGMEHKGVGRDYHGLDGLVTYMNTVNLAEFPLPFEPAPDIVADSFETTRRVCAVLAADGIDIAVPGAPLEVDRHTAGDFMFQNIYPETPRTRVRRILDFGPGIGRQLNVWSRRVPDLAYVGVEAIENSYLCQNAYFARACDLPVTDYMADPESFDIKDAPGIYHLPTWRLDKLPWNYFDLAIFSQVLPELGPELVVELLKLLPSVLKPGAQLYIRDHDLSWLPGHRYDLDAELPKLGFHLEFRPYFVDRQEIHGIPRVWRRIDPRINYRPVAG
jgi:SAM-dependent methyltransferase